MVPTDREVDNVALIMGIVVAVVLIATILDRCILKMPPTDGSKLQTN
jgi:hypothetical protein